MSLYSLFTLEGYLHYLSSKKNESKLVAVFVASKHRFSDETQTQMHNNHELLIIFCSVSYFNNLRTFYVFIMHYISRLFYAALT